jgi:hypothetical protein
MVDGQRRAVGIAAERVLELAIRGDRLELHVVRTAPSFTVIDTPSAPSGFTFSDVAG